MIRRAVAVALLAMALGCSPGTATLVAGSDPACPAEEPSGSCMPPGLSCTYQQPGSACPTRPHRCTASADGGTAGVWVAALCD